MIANDEKIVKLYANKEKFKAETDKQGPRRQQTQKQNYWATYIYIVSVETMSAEKL